MSVFTISFYISSGIAGEKKKNRNSKISGIELPSNKNEASRLKIRHMADDTTLFLHNKEDMIEAKSTINTFSLFSGLRLNAKKTKVMKLGSREKRERRSKSSIQDCRENKDFRHCFRKRRNSKKFRTKLDRKNRKNKTYYTAME